ncbi:alpha/beta fold hydrolase [Gordonia sp. (in: high G+C Gram-positive bacteria)]|uniref:alpha/beta fold hydrolase n=1 Tax=Gordonia sp. (in: high G+C Gram-positive bacteria) TaxID=84139 RepID=UPI0026212085|nr:alpha/beta fold hydrolase [Gordonia sp. (in: high G+C Gram-positive bacteria)]
MEHFTREGLTFDVADSPAHGVAKGTVVLLHGFPQTSSSWRKVTPLLNDAHYRTVAPDQRGYSPRARPKGRAPYRTTELVADTVALIDQLGDGPVHLVGHDWGAAVAWGLASSHPELLRSLTTVSVPHPGAFLKSFLSSSQALHSWYMAAFQPPLVPDLLLDRFPGVLDELLRRSGMDDDQLTDVHRLIESGGLTGALNWYRAMMLSTPPALARRVAVPTTHVWGARDTALVRRGAELAADYVIADYRLEVLEDAGHWIPEHDAEELATIVLERIAASH